MQLTCRRCQGTFTAHGSTHVPCPACGSIDVAAQSPRAATTERPAFSAPVSQPVNQPPSHPPPAAHGYAPLAQLPSYPAPQPLTNMQVQPPGYGPPQGAPHHGPAHGSMMTMPAPYPQGPQPSHYPSYPQPIQVVIQNQIHSPYAQGYAPVPYGMAPYVRRKDAGIATLLSFFLPGAGQIYNGQVGKGLAFLLVSIFVNFPLMFIGVGFITGLITWIWAMIDAHSSAERINRGIVVV